MMLKLVTTNQFEKDLRRMVRRGKDQSKLLQIMQKLLNEERLERVHRDHKLKGPLANRREYHIEYDWLLIYIKGQDRIIFERTGTHSDLFR
jgi:mRNA interferase YafQ